MKKYLHIGVLLVILGEGCSDNSLSWDLPRTNPIDSAQNQNPLDPKGPIASFSTSSVSTVLNGTVNFLSTSTNKPNSFRWEFDGGTPSFSNEPSPSVLYNKIGKFDVKLTALNPFGLDSISKNDYINVYYHKSFSNNQWDGWRNNGWEFSGSRNCGDCIYAWQNLQKEPVHYIINKDFQLIPDGCDLSFYFNVYSPGGSLKVKVNEVEIWSTSGNGSGNPTIRLPSLSSFNLSFEAIIGETQSVYLNDIRINP